VATQDVEQTGVQPPLGETLAGGGRKPTDTNLITPYLFMAPYLVLFVIFILLPVFYGVWISLHNWDYLLPGKPWVGLQNYVNLFTPGSTTSKPFWQSMEATGRFTLYSVPLLVVIPLLIALILNERFPGRTFFRVVYFAPYVLGVAVIGILWRYLLDTNVGLVNYYLGQLGLPDKIPWTNELPWGWVALVGPTVWWTLGFNSVIYLAGLQDIDPALYDAAKVDGANRWRRFLHVTLPGLRPILLFVITVTILASANVFGQAYLITEGAPGDETQTAIMYIAEEGLRNFNMGSAAAMSYVLALFLAVISVANFALFRYRED
jgi:multiple sugar transport system permease protein